MGLKKHMEALVRLGYFEHLEFPMQNIGPGTPEWKGLYQALIKAENFENVENGFFAMRGYEKETKPEVLIWVRVGQRTKYEAIVSSFDHPKSGGDRKTDGGPGN